MTEIDRELRAKVERWIADDADASSQAELRALLASTDGASALRAARSTPEATAAAELADRFAGALEFGTAGLRGIIAAGPNRMNRAVVLRTTHGLAKYLLATIPDCRARGVVIGFDGRRMSREFADDTACVLAANGIKAILFDDYVPTPLCAFAIHALGAAAGVMVTASHNPPQYNGYKAYWQNAAQIIPPIDAGIAAEIDRAPAAREVPRMPVDRARAEGLVVRGPEAVLESYLAQVNALSIRHGADRTFPIVYTPMHGVGGKLMRRAFDRAGFTNVAFVPEQAEPDGAFPTVAFPNPEEKGAMDLAFALGKKNGAALVVANDPDADRLAVAIPLASSPSGFVQLTGNQVGVLLGHYLLTAGKQDGKRFVLASIVSSPLLGVIATELGVGYDETLTGFKWIANRAMERETEEEGSRFVFGFEEALGYTVGDVVRDKDGISAAVMIAELASELRGGTPGKTLLDELESIHRRFGLFVSSQVNVTRPGAEGVREIGAIMTGLRAAKPRRIGAHDVAIVRDYQAQTATRVADGHATPLTLPKSNVLAYELAGGSRIIARPSGTEPKIKFYFDVREAVKEGEPLAQAEARANGVMDAMRKAFVALAEGPRPTA